MNQTIQELTRKLGKAVQEDESYLNYLEAKKENDEDEALQNDIKEMNLLRIKYNAEVSKPAEERDTQKIDSLSKDFNVIYTRVMESEVMQRYNAAKAEVEATMNWVSGVLNLCVNGEDPETCEPPTSCAGDCSGCSGCH